MTWVRKNTSPCRCPKRPGLDYLPVGTGEGSVWRCDCGRQWYLRLLSKTPYRKWETDHFPMRTHG